MSKPQFEKYRKWYYVALAYMIGIAFFIGYDICQRLSPEIANGSGFGNTRFWVLMALNGIGIVAIMSMGRYSACPRCGESVFPWWGSRAMVSRILKRKPIICSHCGEEVEIVND